MTFVTKTGYVSIPILLIILGFYYIDPSKYKVADIVRLGSSSERKHDKLDDYIVIQENIVKNNLTHNIVHVENYQYGYGNRVYRMLTGLTIAILSDSACYVTWEINKPAQPINYYFDSPLPQFFNSYPQKSALFYNLNFTVVLDNPKNKWPEQKPFKSLTMEIPEMTDLRVTVKEERAVFFLICANPKYYQKLLSYDLVSKETIERASAIEKLTNERSKEEALLQIGFEVSGRLLNKFFIPSNYMQTQINNFVRDNFNGYFVIGFQLRVDYVNGDDVDVFLNCALEIEYQMYSNLKDKSLFKPVKWFITSDYAKYIEAISAKYKDKIILGNGAIGHVESNHNAYFRSVLDNELLANCDEYIYSAGSTFGFIPVIRSQRLSYFTRGGIGAKKCEKMTLSRPGANLYQFSTFK